MSGKKGVPQHRWTTAERARLAEVAPGRSHDEIHALMTAEFGDHFGGTRIGAAMKRYGVRSGLDGRFAKGQKPHNKGKTWAEFMSPEGQANSRRTQYKPGNLPHNAVGKHAGYERVDKDGYIEVKVKDGLQGEANDNFRMKHHVVWETHNGAIPPGTMIVFADHDKRNFDPANLVAVPRPLWAVISRKRLQYWDAESLRTCMLIAEVDHAKHAAQRRPRPCKRCGEVFEPRYAHQRTCDKCLGR